MKAWIFLLGGLLVWTAHFFGAYIIGSLFPGTELARSLVLALTLLCLGIAGLFVFLILRRKAAQNDTLDRWSSALAGSGHALAIVAIAYQGLPALLN